MEIQLRQEQPGDWRETENVVREAFWNHFSPACEEHYLIHRMRQCDTFVPELDIVAVENTKIVGNVMSLRSYIEGDDGKRREVLSMGPIGVLPSHQKQGIGGMLIAQTKVIARAMGFRALLLCGDSHYYTRQGFIAAEHYGIRTSENMLADYLHACELYPGALADAKGRYFENSIYEVDKEAVAEFDKLFPHKEVIAGTSSQKAFMEAITKIREYRPPHSPIEN